MGGMIAQDFYRLFPERVLSLVLVDTNNGLRRSLSPEQIDTFVKIRRDPLLAGKTPREMAPPVARALSGPKATPETIRRLEESMAALRTDSYVKTLEEMSRYDGFPDLITVQVPTLVVVGEADRLTPPRDSEAMIAAIPGAEYHLIPQAGHLSNIEDPDLFNSVVLEFLLRRGPTG
jgi:3-oxoadipate enol-lactonase